MGIPVLIEEMKFDDGICSLAANLEGDKIAVGTKGLLGVYQIKRDGGKAGLSHLASFAIPGEKDSAVTFVSFSGDGKRLFIRSEDGYERELSLVHKKDGLLVELSCSPIEVTVTDHVVASRLESL